MITMCDIDEVEDKEPLQVMFDLVDALNTDNSGKPVTCSLIIQQREQRRSYDDFWSDICWSEG